MRSILFASASVTAIGLLASSGMAQAFNIDFGTTSPVPSVPYGAASGQAGHWNVFAGGPTALQNTAAAATGVSIVDTLFSFPSGANDPLTLGDDDALLDDYMAVPFHAVYTVNGLAAGTYDVYSYTWTFGPLSTGIDVNTQGVQVIGGVWSGSFTPGSYSLHTVTIAASQPLVIDVYSINGALGAIAGVQIVPVPTPGAAAAMGLGALAALRRRRK